MSDNEEDSLSDGTAWSTNSIDDLLASEDVDAPADAWISELGDRIEQILDRKRSSVQGREETLAAYAYLLTAHYAKEEIYGKLRELYPGLLKSVKSGGSDRETILAMKALSLTVITCPSDIVYDDMSQPLKNQISDSQSSAVKAAACHSLATAASFGGASDDEIEDVMDYLLSIVESDGEMVDAFDAGDVVCAALQNWGFLATQIDDLENTTEAAMEAFVEQLSSSDMNVQVAAGENIALLFEKSYTELEDDEDPPSEDEDDDGWNPNKGPKMVKRYEVWRRQDQLVEQLEQLASISGRSISKKDRKNMHVNFRDILHGVEHPTRGPRYETALDPDGRMYGSRMAVRIYKNAEMKIDTWEKLQRLNALRRILQGGFLVHYENNPAVGEILPQVLSRR